MTGKSVLPASAMPVNRRQSMDSYLNPRNRSACSELMRLALPCMLASSPFTCMPACLLVSGFVFGLGFELTRDVMFRVSAWDHDKGFVTVLTAFALHFCLPRSRPSLASQGALLPNCSHRGQGFSSFFPESLSTCASRHFLLLSALLLVAIPQRSTPCSSRTHLSPHCMSEWCSLILLASGCFSSSE
jgi:hypothetical protein